MYQRSGLGALTTTAAGAAAGSVIPGVGTVVGGFAGNIIGNIFSGHHYTGPKFVPDGVLNWAAQGHWDYVQQVATTGHGPHWSEPASHPGGVNYDLSSPGDVGAYGSIPGNIPLGRWLTLFLQTYAPRAQQDPVTGAPTYSALAPSQLAPAPAQTVQTSTAGFGGGVLPWILGLGLVGGLVYAARIRPRTRYANPSRRPRRSNRRRSSRRRRR